MTTRSYRIAHIREQGQDMIFIPVQSLSHASHNDIVAIVDGLQRCAVAAGLAGTVVLCWQSGGQTRFMGPPQWAQLFNSLSWERVHASRNKVLYCDYAF